MDHCGYILKIFMESRTNRNNIHGLLLTVENGILLPMLLYMIFRAFPGKIKFITELDDGLFP